METLVVYYSDFGNTRRIAEAIAETAMRAGEARTVSIDQLTASHLEGADLVVMGSPTHYQNLPKACRAVLDGLPGGVLASKPVAAFDTSLKMWGALMLMTAAHRLRSKLRKLGGKPVVKAETFLVGERDRELEGEQDLLYPGEIERAKEWAGEILNRLEW